VAVLLYHFVSERGMAMNPWDMLLDRQPPSNYIAPLFWQHGESESVLREEIRKMREGGIGGCIVESRPHPDFMGPRWWHDLDVILDEARKQGDEGLAV
jgi:hypothetical protein